MTWFFDFLLYSFFGFLLEVVFARLTRNPKRDRKCFLLLPLCPVYGLGALAILSLPFPVKENPWLLLLLGGAAATATEYLTSLFYQKFVGVSFWDYSHLPGNLGGHVCLLFSGFWGLLALALVYWIHPFFAPITGALPPLLALPWAMVLAADGAVTLLLLTRTHTTDSLIWYRRRVSHPG